MPSPEHLGLVRGLAAALAALDETALARVCHPDVRWTIPGSSVIAGRHTGVDGVLSVQRTLRSRGVTAEPRGILTGRDSLVVLLHDNGSFEGRRLELDIALLVEIRDGRITALASHLADPDALDAYLR